MFIDELIGRIDQRLAELATELAQLQAAQTALRGTSKPPAREAAARKTPAATRRTLPRRPRGEAGRLLLEALADGNSRTASQLSALTKIPVYTVNPELAKHRKSKAVVKAKRGYAIAAS